MTYSILDGKKGRVASVLWGGGNGRGGRGGVTIGLFIFLLRDKERWWNGLSRELWGERGVSLAMHCWLHDEYVRVGFFWGGVSSNSVCFGGAAAPLLSLPIPCDSDDPPKGDSCPLPLAFETSPVPLIIPTPQPPPTTKEPIGPWVFPINSYQP